MSDRINATTLQAVFSSGTHRAASSVNATIRSPRVVSTLTLLFIPVSPFLKFIWTSLPTSLGRYLSRFVFWIELEI
jgi:hypothetical protein